MQMNDFTPVQIAASPAAAIENGEAWEILRRQTIALALSITTHPSFDFRRMLTKASSAEMAGKLMWQLIRGFEPAVLIGPGFGATPLLYATAQAARADGVDLAILMVRDKRKEHNGKKWIEGLRQPAGSRAVLIDDFLGKGTAIDLVEQALKAEKQTLDIKAIAVFFDNWNPLGARQISVSRYPVVSVFSRHDIGLSRDSFDAKPPLMRGSYPEFIGKRRWWRYTLNDRKGHNHKCSPLVADNAVFVGDDHGRVFRHNGQDGSIEWSYDSLEDPAKGIVQILQHADDSIAFGCYDGTLTRLDKATGRIVWRWRLDSSIHATPELDLARGRLFVSTEQYNEGNPFGHLYCIDWKTGRTVWRFRHGYWPPGSPVYSAEHKRVFATCNDRSLVCVHADSGELVWRHRNAGLVRGKPAVDRDRVYIANERGFLQCLDQLSGKVIWARQYGRPGKHQFLYVHRDVVIVLDGQWHLTAFDTGTGAVRWLMRLRSAGCWTPVAFGRYLVVLSAGGEVAVIDPDREIKVWESGIGGRHGQPPALGIIDGKPVFAAASIDQGLKVFDIDPFYGPEHP